MQLTKEKRTQDVTKWEKWYNNQNASTKAYLDEQNKEDNKFAFAVGMPMFVIGVIIGFLLGL